jgi:pimeloyl-ACP methyl ester carboxylesterase
MPDTTVAQHRSHLSFVDVAGGRMAYLDVGPRDGRPVVLVHGMPTSSYLYRQIAPRLAEAGLRAIAPDLLGFGASDKPHDRSAYAAPDQGARLTALLDHLGIDSATFVAHDLGGPWVFEVADHTPERISSLVVLNTSAYAELMTPPREARLVGGPLGPLMLAVMGSRAGKGSIRKFFNDFTHDSHPMGREAVEAHWLPLHEGGTRAFRTFARGLDATMAEFARYAAALRRLDVPATVVWGSADPVLRSELMIPRFAEDLAIAPEDVHVLEQSSHFLQEDQPEAVADLIATFVLRLSAQAA